LAAYCAYRQAVLSISVEADRNGTIVPVLQDFFKRQTALFFSINPGCNHSEKEELAMISKAGSIKMLRVLAIGCAIAMGFMTLVGTSEDDATDALGIDDSFNETAEFELDPVTVEKPGVLPASILAAGDECNTMTIDAALDAVKDDIEDLDKVDIKSVKLNNVQGSYTADWLPLTKTFSCSLTITGSQDPITIAETVVNGLEGTIDDTTLTQAQIDVINYYLANRSEEFTYCLVCDDTDIESYTVTYNVEIGVTIKGDIDVL
jgi:hypothetical protein